MLRGGLSIGHFGVFPENAQKAFVGVFEDVIGHVIVEIGPESLGDETLTIDLMKEVADAIRCIGGTAMPGLAAEEVEVSRLHEQGRGALAVEGWIFWIVGLSARIVAARHELAGAILVFVLVCQGDLERHAKNGHLQTPVMTADIVVRNWKFQAVIYVKAVNTQIPAVQDASLRHAMALWAEDCFGNRYDRLAHEQIAEHPVAFK